MTSQGFGAGGFAPGGFGNMADSAELAALARQYWSQWGEMLRAGGQGAPVPGFAAGSGFPGMGFPGGSGPTATAGLPGWNEAVDWWSQLASGGMPQADATVQRFSTQARDWYAQIQQLAARFAGQDASAGEVTQAWKEMFGGHAGNPFVEAMQGMQGQGQQGFEQWLQQVSPWLEKMREERSVWLGVPTFGVTREHKQRWKELLQAQQDYQRHSQGYQALMKEALQNAFKRFETKLGECSQPGNKLDSMHALFNLWIDAAEEAYAEIAMSPRFSDAYGAMGDAQMLLRSAVQKEVEQLGDAMGMPSRTEVDAAHRKITQLERQLRQLRAQIEAAASREARPATMKAATSGATEPDSAPASSITQPAAAGKPATRERDSGGTATKKAAKKVTKNPARKTAKAAAGKAPAKSVAKKTARTTAAKKAAVGKAPSKKSTASVSRAAVKKTTTKAS